MITHRAPRPIPVKGHDDLFSCYHWHPEMADNVILRMSKSSLLSDFGFCQQQGFIKRIVGMKEPQNDNMLRGTNVHDSVELFYDRVDPTYAESLLFTKGDGKEQERVSQYFKGCFPKPPEIRSAQEAFYLDEDLHLDRWRQVEVERFFGSDPENFLPTGNELVVDHIMDIEVDGISQPVHFTGIIDRIFTNPDGSLHVHELKTGLWKDTKYKYESMRKEMAFYVWMLRKMDGSTPVTHWGWDHTKGGKGTDTEDAEAFRHVEPVRVKEIGLMLADVQNLIRNYRRYKGDGDGSMFPLISASMQSRLCDPWCALKEFCPRYADVLEDY